MLEADTGEDAEGREEADSALCEGFPALTCLYFFFLGGIINVGEWAWSPNL